MTTPDEPPPATPDDATTDAEQLTAAVRVRRWLGADAVDVLLGASGPDSAARALLATRPQVTEHSVQDGLDLVADRHRDHPDGLPAERWGARIARVRNLMGALTLVVLLALLVAGFVARQDTGVDDPFEALEAQTSPEVLRGAVLALLAPLAVGVLLLWVTSVWRHVITLAEARYAVRWAASRAGQRGRGVPVADPFPGLAGPAMALSVMGWVIGGLALLLCLLVLSDPVLALVLICLAAAVLLPTWPLMRWRREMRRAGAVASAHLLILGTRDDGVRLDVATSVQEHVLVVVQLPLTSRWHPSEERVVYPLTAVLPRDELARRHDQVDQDLAGLVAVGPRHEAPLVTVERNAEDHHLDVERYSGGWVVALGTRSGRPAALVVPSDPERFVAEVLPTLGDRHGLESGSLRVHEPRQVATGGSRWMQGWDPRDDVDTSRTT